MSSKFKKIITNRFVIFSIFFLLFFCIQLCYGKNLLPSSDTENLWFYSGIVMVLFSILFIEPYYSSPKNVLTNTIPLLLVMLAIKNEITNPTVAVISIAFLCTLIMLSLVALSLNDENKSHDHYKNRIAQLIKNIVVFIGQGKFLYSFVFVYFLLTYFSIQSSYTLIMFLLWFLILIIDPKKIGQTFNNQNSINEKEAIGEIFSVQFNKNFLVKIFENKRNLEKYDLVKFRYSMQKDNNASITGTVLDVYSLNNEKWAKVLQLTPPIIDQYKLSENTVYKITDTTELSKVIQELNIDRIVGIVSENSTIGTIKFEYSKKIDNIQEGDLLELCLSGKRIFYQVINGKTQKKDLSDKNISGFIEGEAIQIGEWQNENLSFLKYGWVPTINSILYKADTSNIEIPKIKYPFFQVGVIPGTSLPSVINLDDAIGYHSAIVGISGSGKTFLATEIITQISIDTKVICVDITGEWEKNIEQKQIHSIIDKEKFPQIEQWIAERESAIKVKDSAKALAFKQTILDRLQEYITVFEKSSKNIALFELPNLSNTTFILEFTQLFLEGVFLYARNNPGKKHCIVLEEAHTIIPETSFLGELGDYSSNKGLVNKMGQIALQGRKYGVGLLIIAQRTANVSKTVLTQCNTIICFQAFDDTSFNFLGNYVGDEMIQSLPNLKRFHAIIAGKAVNSNTPMIVDVTKK